MPRMTKEEKRIDAETSQAFKTHGNGIEFDIFDLSKIHNAGIEAGRRGENIEDAVKAAIQLYRKDTTKHVMGLK
jgi:hypothetical protein